MNGEGVTETFRGFDGKIVKLRVPKGKELFLPLFPKGEAGAECGKANNLLDIQVWLTAEQWAWLENLFLYWNCNFIINRTTW